MAWLKDRGRWVVYALLILLVVMIGCDTKPDTKPDNSAGGLGKPTASARGGTEMLGNQEDWAALQKLLTDSSPTLTKPPTGVVTGKYTGGQLLGNGEIGVVAGDSVSQQTFYFGKGDFWGKLVKDTKANPPVWQDGILSVGGMTFRSAAAANDPASVYRMTQDIQNAEVRTTMRFGNSTVNMTSWTADSDDVFVTELSLAEGSGPVEIQASLWVPDKITLGGKVQDNASTYPYSSGVADGTLWVTRENNLNGSSDYKARVAVAVKLVGASFDSTTDGSFDIKSSFTVKPGAPVQVAAVFKSGKGIGNQAPAMKTVADSAIKAAETLTADKIAELRVDHRNFWKEYWLKSYVDVHDSLLNNYYYGSLYVAGSASRAGHFAPSLWGNWVTGDLAGWGGRYFLNYNEEALYYGVFSSNRPEISKPYLDLIYSEAPYQRNKTAAAGYKGLAFQRSLTPYNLVRSAPGAASVAAKKDWTRLPADQKSNAGFATLPLIWYWEYTRDADYLKTKLYPILRQMDEFWRDFMEKDGERYVIRHSSAHEGGDDTNPNLDLGFIRKLCGTLMETSQLMGVDVELRPVWQDVLDHLSPYPTGQVNGQEVYYIAETVDYHNPSLPNLLFEPGNQPINMEGTVFPGETLSIGGDAAALQIAKNTMTQMNSWGVTSGGNTHNGFPKIWPIAARIGWPAEDLLNKFKAAIQYLWRPSNHTAYEGGGGIETAGSIEALNSMLMQSEGGVIRIFPAWPKGKDASFKRLRAKGAFLVSSDLSGGTVRFVDITSEKGTPVKVIHPFSGSKVSVTQMNVDGSAGAAVTAEITADTIIFPTEAGKSYKITPVS